MENFNIQLLQAENAINEALKGLPVGAAYFLIKNKTAEVEAIYLQQAKQEYDAAVAAEQRNAQIQRAHEEGPTMPDPDYVQDEPAPALD